MGEKGGILNSLVALFGNLVIYGWVMGGHGPDWATALYHAALPFLWK